VAEVNPTGRFSNRVADYVRTRPGYPIEVLELLRAEANLTAETIIADVGSGTGLSSEMFLKNGNVVIGIEPNEEMRQAGEAYLATYPKFRSIAGRAEATTLADQSVDKVVAGQAFHWFDPLRARLEFLRILRPPKTVVLLWNTRKLDTTPFLREFELLLQTFGTDYREVVHTNVDREKLQAFFGSDYTCRTLPNEQGFDREGLRGRVRSSSYTPPVGDPNHVPMMRRLDELFDKYKETGQVRFEYDTEVYFGRLSGGGSA
jgi:SAM-dependent methyltransferase